MCSSSSSCSRCVPLFLSPVFQFASARRRSSVGVRRVPVPDRGAGLGSPEDEWKGARLGTLRSSRRWIERRRSRYTYVPAASIVAGIAGGGRAADNSLPTGRTVRAVSYGWLLPHLPFLQRRSPGWEERQNWRGGRVLGGFGVWTEGREREERVEESESSFGHRFSALASSRHHVLLICTIHHASKG